MSESVLDQELVRELKEVMADSFPALVDSFRSDSLTRLRDLEAACISNEAEEVRLLAHSFKGSSSNVGAMKVSMTCKEIENLAVNEQLDVALNLLSRLKNELEESLTELEVGK